MRRAWMSKTCKNLALREIIHKHTYRSNRRAICTLFCFDFPWCISFSMFFLLLLSIATWSALKATWLDFGKDCVFDLNVHLYNINPACWKNDGFPVHLNIMAVGLCRCSIVTAGMMGLSRYCQNLVCHGRDTKGYLVCISDTSNFEKNCLEALRMRMGCWAAIYYPYLCK